MIVAQTKRLTLHQVRQSWAEKSLANPSPEVFLANRACVATDTALDPQRTEVFPARSIVILSTATLDARIICGRIAVPGVGSKKDRSAVRSLSIQPRSLLAHRFDFTTSLSNPHFPEQSVIQRASHSRSLRTTACSQSYFHVNSLMRCQTTNAHMSFMYVIGSIITTFPGSSTVSKWATISASDPITEVEISSFSSCFVFAGASNVIAAGEREV